MVSLTGRLPMKSTASDGFAALAVCEARVDTSNSVVVGSGSLWIKRTVPPTEPEPYSVPCGPRSTSTRAMSVILRFANSGVSST